MTAPAIQTVADEKNRNGESPLWDAARGRLLWVDNVTGGIFEYDPATGKSARLADGLPVCGLALNGDGRLLLAGSKGLVLWKSGTDLQTVCAEHDGEALVFNDITVDARGNVYGGTFYWGADGMEKRGKLYLIRPDAAVEVLDEGILLSNGLGFSPDGGRLYFTDTMDRKIYAYDVDAASGILKNRRVFVDVPRGEGLPDGLTVDAKGFVWSAQWYAGEVVRYDPDGKVERRLRVPVQQVSSVMFGGKDLADLYITSAGEYWPSEDQPPAFDPSGPMGGALYRTRPGVIGCPRHCSRFLTPA
ncbi:MAG: SMP-30/gluconolactonase/LRE family protein [Verrucomicrobia bacterium]|jgi:D-xylonolactonase|nr:SMP-30/gluconolactonase/LRE family protein [Verrucomicrobiota bacterium]